jgi:uncharacterized protein YjbI with pentapeptide repeats
MSWFVTLLLAVSLSQGYALDLNFRFESGYCQKNKAPGSNPEFLGECGNLTRSRQINQRWTDLNLKGGIFNASYFYRTEVTDSDLSHAAFRRSVILQSSFVDMTANNLDLRGAHLKGVNFRNSELDNLFATGTRFTRVQFSSCNLQNANFWGSQLQEVDFTRADLRGANLSQTMILLSRFTGARFNDQTQLPFTEKEALQRGMVKID